MKMHPVDTKENILNVYALKPLNVSCKQRSYFNEARIGCTLHMLLICTRQLIAPSSSWKCTNIHLFRFFPWIKIGKTARKLGKTEEKRREVVYVLRRKVL